MTLTEICQTMGEVLAKTEIGERALEVIRRGSNSEFGYLGRQQHRQIRGYVEVAAMYRNPSPHQQVIVRMTDGGSVSDEDLIAMEKGDSALRQVYDEVVVRSGELPALFKAILLPEPSRVTDYIPRNHGAARETDGLCKEWASLVTQTGAFVRLLDYPRAPNQGTLLSLVQRLTADALGTDESKLSSIELERNVPPAIRSWGIACVAVKSMLAVSMQLAFQFFMSAGGDPSVLELNDDNVFSMSSSMTAVGAELHDIKAILPGVGTIPGEAGNVVSVNTTGGPSPGKFLLYVSRSGFNWDVNTGGVMEVFGPRLNDDLSPVRVG